MKAARPPTSGLILARRRALTVPALLLVTISSTVPRRTLKTVTGTGSGRKMVSRTNRPTPANPPSRRTHFSQRRTRTSSCHASCHDDTTGALGHSCENRCMATRRTFVKAAAFGGLGTAYLGGAHLALQDDRWTPNRSFWVSRGRAPVTPPLRGEASADLAIIGGGVTGLSTAIHAL